MSPYVSQGNSALWLLTLWRCNRRQQSLIAVPRNAIRASLIPVGRHPTARRRPGPPVRKTIPAAAVYGGILLALVLLVVAIWGFGGFKKRTDLLQTIPPGTPFTTGPYEFRFSAATAQHKKKYDGTLYWEIVMIGEGRTTGSESILPALSDSGMFVSKDDASQQVKLFDKAQGPFLAVGVPRTAAIAY
jgi:hypothetical protein